MKKSYLAYFLLVLLWACSSDKTNSVSLNGEIKGLGNDTVYIYGTDKFYNRIDTLIVENDKFLITLDVDTLVDTRLQFSNGTEYPLYLNKGGKIQIKGSAAELSALEISGNTPNEEFTAYQNELKGLAKPSKKALQKKAEDFIIAHPYSLVSIYLLEKYFVQLEQPNINHIQRLIDRMSGELKDRPYIDELQSMLKEEEKALVGQSAPYFNIPNAMGKDINRSNFNDKYLLMQFWASWDGPSREANATLRRIYKKEKKNKHFAFLGISLDIDKEAWKEAIETDTLDWEQVCSFAGWEAVVANQFAIRTLPTNLLLNPNGKIVGKDMSEEEIKDKLKEIEKEEKEKKEAEKKRRSIRR